MNRLRHIRLSKRMTVSELSRVSNVSRQTIHRLEIEENDSANSKTLKQLAEALGVKVSDFFVE